MWYAEYTQVVLYCILSVYTTTPRMVLIVSVGVGSTSQLQPLPRPLSPFVPRTGKTSLNCWGIPFLEEVEFAQ